MLENCRTAKERWGGVSEIIDRWLQERQEMLVRYCELTGNEGFDGRNPDDSKPVRELCQVMMDYVSAGHFEVYEQLLREAKEFNDTSALKEAKELYGRVEETTDAVLDFNDKYQETDDLTAFSRDLSAIGEILASRFETEDRMIEVLHMAHRDLVA
jgi:regulator of sigma D